MDTAAVSNVLLYCAIINYGLLLLWFAVFVLAHDWMYRLHGRWFRMTTEQFNAIHYLSMAIYKLGIFLLNLVPWIALQIVA